MINRHQQVLLFGDFQLHPMERKLLRGGVEVSLTPKVFDTLLFLIENRGLLLSKDVLMRAFWPDTIVEEITLARNISHLRKALGEDRHCKRFIQTVSKIGYRFVAEVSESSNDVTAVSTQGRAPLRTATSLGSQAWSGTRSGIVSIAVLPFKPLTLKGRAGSMGLGMADALISKLSNIHRLAVRPTSAVLKYGKVGQDAVEVGREQRVQAVLEGHIQVLGSRLRVSVQLVNVSDGRAIWAAQFDQPLTDLFALQDSISTQVTQTLIRKLSGEDEHRLNHRYTESMEAWRAYVEGRYFWNKRTATGLKKAISYFEQAIARDPRFALAYSGLADAYLLTGDYGFVLPSESVGTARTAAFKAVEFDDNLAEAHTSLAWIAGSHDWNWAESEREYQRAIELNPNYSTAHHWYAESLAVTGRFNEAIREIRIAQDLDPLSPAINNDAGLVYFFAKRHESAIEQLRKAVELDPYFAAAYFNQALVYEQLGQLAEAIGCLQLAGRLLKDDPLILAALGRIYAVTRKRTEAKKVIERLIVLSRHRRIDPALITLIHVALGNRDQVFAGMERQIEERSTQILMINVHPAYDSLRSDPRFSDVLLRIAGLGFPL